MRHQHRWLPLALALVLAGCGQLPAAASPPGPKPPPPPPPVAERPAHPGTIVFADLDLETEHERPVAEVPETIAWVEVDGLKVPVVRVESRRMSDTAREIKKIGPSGEVLESTIQVRQPPPFTPR